MEDPTNLIDLNTAGRNEIRNLPGVGRALTDRILAARPFTSIEDLARVSGVGPVLLDSLRPYITVSPCPPEGGEMTPDPTAEAQAADPLAAGQPGEDALGSRMPEHRIQAEAAQVEVMPAAQEPAPAQTEQIAGVEGRPPSVEESLVFPGATDEEMHEEDKLPAVEAAPAEAVPLAAAEEPEIRQPESDSRVSPKPAISQPGYFSRSQVLGIAIAGVIASFLLSIFFIFTFLSAINGGLHFARALDVERLQGQVQSLNDQLSPLQSQLSDMNTRLAAVEAMSGRVSTVEEQAAALRTDVDAANAQVTGLQENISTLSLQVDALLTRTNRFQGFLDGLRSLLDGLSTPEVP